MHCSKVHRHVKCCQLIIDGTFIELQIQWPLLHLLRLPGLLRRFCCKKVLRFSLLELRTTTIIELCCFALSSLFFFFYAKLISLTWLVNYQITSSLAVYNKCSICIGKKSIWLTFAHFLIIYYHFFLQTDAFLCKYYFFCYFTFVFSEYSHMCCDISTLKQL